jgi:formylglycine-generating enzyme required for sulfatase activity
MDLPSWKEAVARRLRDSAQFLKEMTPGTLYGMLAASSILPVVVAANGGDFAAIATLTGVVGGVGGNLLANQIQNWKDRSDVELAAELGQLAATQPEWQEALDALVLNLETPRIVQAILGEAEWDRFERLLRQELAQLGNGERYASFFVDTQGGTYVQGDANVGGDFVNRDKITHIYHSYQTAPGRPKMDEEQFARAVNRYLDWVSNRYGQLNLRGIQRREKQPLTLSLDDVYVSLQAAVAPDRNERRRNRGARKVDEAEEAQIQTIDMAQLLGLGKRLAIIGGPGSGKTTFLHVIAASLAHALLTGEGADVGRHLGLTHNLPLPIFVTLSDYNRYRRQNDNAAHHDARQGTLTAFLSHSLIRQEAALGLPDDFFERLLGQGQSCILLLDGLDEVADERERMLVRQAVENLAANQGVGQMLVTSRTRAFQGRSRLAEDFRVAEVQPMRLEQAQALADRWCRAVYDVTRAPDQSSSLQVAIANLDEMRAKRGEKPLVDSPLMVTIVAIVHYNDRRLPDERADLYSRCVDVLLTESYHPDTPASFELVDWGGSERVKRSLLAYLAFRLMSAGEESGRSADAVQMRSWLLPQFAKTQGEAQAGAAVDVFLQAMCERGSLLDERGGRYQFIHLTFQEFLCAAHLVDTVRERSEIVRLLFTDGRIAQSWWRETVLLTVGYMGLDSIDAPLALVQTLATHQAEASVTVGAAEVTAVAFLEQNGVDAATRKLLCDRLVALITDPNHPGSPEQRLAAGKALAQLGDPRPGVGLRPDGLPDIDWVMIPERDALGQQEFVYGEKEEKRSEATFWMARYPVTYRQFQAFVDAPDGLANPDWWKGLARTDNNNLRKQSFPFWNHPRESVTWYQAVAFCRWLTAKVEVDPSLLPTDLRGGRWRISLPTEWQWEKAARGHDGRVYPWGAKYIQGYANVEKDGPHNLQSSSAVGLYPQGVSPYGILDLSGNVWEWCLNEYSNPQRVGESGDETRVLRGGAWFWEADRAKSSARFWHSPNFWSIDLGFRLVLVPISRVAGSGF